MANAPIVLEGFNDVEKQIALAWTQSHFTQFLSENPDATLDARIKKFSDLLEGSLYIVDEIRKAFDA